MRHTNLMLMAFSITLGGSAVAQPLAQKLNLTPAQEPLFAEWNLTNYGNPAQLKALSSQELAADNATAYVANNLAWMEYRLEWTRRADKACRNLYVALTPAQRIIFNAAILPKTEKDAPPVDPVPASEVPPNPDPNAAEETPANWSRVPNGDEFEAFYPPKALQERKAGKATISCEVTLLGLAVGCVVDHEEPRGYGFGNATIEIASAFRFHPSTFYGVPKSGKVTIPLNWQIDPSELKLLKKP